MLESLAEEARRGLGEIYYCGDGWYALVSPMDEPDEEIPPVLWVTRRLLERFWPQTRLWELDRLMQAERD